MSEWPKNNRFLFGRKNEVGLSLRNQKKKSDIFFENLAEWIRWIKAMDNFYLAF